MSLHLTRAFGSESDIVIHDWADDSATTIDIGHTENVITEGSSGKTICYLFWASFFFTVSADEEVLFLHRNLLFSKLKKKSIVNLTPKETAGFVWSLKRHSVCAVRFFMVIFMLAIGEFYFVDFYVYNNVYNLLSMVKCPCAISFQLFIVKPWNV